MQKYMVYSEWPLCKQTKCVETYVGAEELIGLASAQTRWGHVGRGRDWGLPRWLSRTFE